MRFLFDQNLSHRLKQLLKDLYPDSLHVQDVRLDSNLDINVWEHARSENLVIVTKDFDFVELSERLGHPPKVVRLSLGNAPTTSVVSLLRNSHEEIRAFCEDETRSSLTLP